MRGGDPTDAAKGVKQHLETDALLGAKDLPVSPDRVAELRESQSAQDAAAPSASAGRAAGSDAADSEAKAELLNRLWEDHARECTKCHLSETRTQVVFGQGDPSARLVFVGEAPGFEEDRQGIAFIGRAGQLLTAMIEKGMGLSREDVYICNVLKCRPPNNRTPSTDEIAACSPYLLQQLQIIQPEVIVALGAPAAQTLLDTRDGIGRLRGRFHDFYPSGLPMSGEPVPLMPTYHPAYLLRSPGEKRKAWEDLKLVMERLDLPIPEKFR